MADRGDANRFAAVSQLVEDPIGADPERIQPPQFSPQRVAGSRFTLEEAKRILARVDQWPAQFEQVTTGPSGEDESGQ